MAPNNSEFHIARQLRMIEWLKAELVATVGILYKALVKNSEEAIVDALANLVIGSYLLGKRLGVSFSKLDGTIAAHLASPAFQEHEIEQWHGDVTNLQNHWEERGRQS